jgi:gentisate 1,2-dioxygenase
MEITVTDRWWPTQSERLADLAGKNVPMTDGERAEAEREKTAAERRRKSPPLMKRSTIRLQQSSHKGVHVGHIISPHLGFDTHMLAAEIHHMRPGASTEMHRHSERVVHVMTGSGYSLIDGQRYEWEPGDTLHIKQGLWHQHFNTGSEPANFLVGMASRLLEHMVPHPLVYKGDSFSDVPDDFQPEHPFGLGPQEVIPVDVEKWMSSVHKGRRQRVQALEEQSRTARTILKWNEAKIERSHHKGDWKVALADIAVGFDTRMVTMAIHQLPPGAHTETHKHEEAIVYVRTGRGFSIIEGERFEWEAGDCFHIQPGVWHQHWNLDPERVSQHIAILTTPLLERIATFPGLEVKEDPSLSYDQGAYEPRLPWQFDYSVPWPKDPARG